MRSSSSRSSRSSRTYVRLSIPLGLQRENASNKHFYCHFWVPERERRDKNIVLTAYSSFGRPLGKGDKGTNSSKGPRWDIGGKRERRTKHVTVD